MAREAVISCPLCVRQYAVDPSMGGRLASCYACKSTFFIALAQTGLGEPVVSLINPLEPRWKFFQEGCAEMARNVAALLGLADMPVTGESVRKVVESVPHSRSVVLDKAWRTSFCCQTIERACERSLTPEAVEQLRDLGNYFLYRVPRLSDATLDMLTGAFLGVLSEKSDAPTPVVAPVLPKRTSWWRPW